MSPLEVPARIPPHNLDAERAVLGAVLLDGRETLPRVIEVLRPSDFYTEAHRAIYETMLRLFDRGEPVDLITLSEELRRNSALDLVGGPAALALLVEHASIAAHLSAYSSIVRDMAVLRELIQTSTQIITQAFDAKEDVQTLVDDAERKIFGLAERRLEGSALPIGKILKNTFEYIERLYERKENVTGVATGFEKLDLETSGLQPSDFVIIAGRPSMGKAQPLDAKVKTVTGWKRMGDLRAGDELASIDGRRSRVRAIFPQGAKRIYRVTFSDGRSTECTGEHRWRVHDRGWPEPRTLSTEEVAAKLQAKRYQYRLGIDTPSGEYGHREALPLDPWLLGTLLGEGTLSGRSLGFSPPPPEMLGRLVDRASPEDVLWAAGGGAGRVVPAVGAHRPGMAGGAHDRLMRALRQLGLWGIRNEDTFIPDVYLNASREARVELLGGFMETEGWQERSGRARFCSASERLAGNVAELVRSLGGGCSVHGRRTTSTGNGTKNVGRRVFVCTIHHSDSTAIIQRSVKPGRALTAPGRPWRPVFVSVEAVRVAEAQCISVTHPSGLYITDDHVVTHNTAFALNIAQYVGVQLRGKVLVLSLEMSAPQLVQRMLCSEAKVDSQAVRTGRLSSSDWHRLTAAAGRLSEAGIFIDDSPGLTVLEARAKARRMKAEHGLELLVIDYLQLMRGRAAMESRQQEISEISRSLKALAKELAVPVVALSQLSRAVESRAIRDFRPQLSDLRECVTGNTLVVLADGRRIPIRDLVGTAPEVLAMSPTGKIVPAKSERIWGVGTRAIVSVQLASGRVIRATRQHRLLSAQGWVRVEELSAGDRLASARRLPEPPFPECWPDRRVALLGQLIGDGSDLSHQPLRHTTRSEANSTVVAEAAREEFGCDVRRDPRRGSGHRLVISGNGNRWHPGGVNGWLRALGIFGQRSYQKRIPEAVFQLSNRQIALLLRHLWATEGGITCRTTGRGSHRIVYGTMSPGLASDVVALLLRLGIVARIVSARADGDRPAFHVVVSGATDQRAFLEVVGAIGAREPQARRRSLMRKPGLSDRPLAAIRGTADGNAIVPSRELREDDTEILTDEQLRAPALNDLFWDRITSIQPGGEEPVFDLTVPGPACWLADGVVSHNSGALEQDADLILFLYRQSLYKEDLPPDEANLADVIIGKQRNGPVGTVKVVFLPQYARFENVADYHRQPQPF